MSTLPDITTSNVGYIAYWNALNHGVGSINASDVLSDGNIQSYTLYDNGFTAQYSGITRTFTVRVKQDGWFVAYIDRTNQYNAQASSQQNGYWDILNDWTNTGTNISTFPNNVLERSIHSLQSQLSNSGSITYNSSDVGLYNYQYTSATTSTQFGSTYNIGPTRHSNPDHYSGLLYTANTNISFASSQGSASANGGSSSCSFEGVTIVTNSDSPSSINLLSRGLIPNSQTEYDAKLSVSTNDNTGSYAHSHPTVLTMWS